MVSETRNPLTRNWSILAPGVASGVELQLLSLQTNRLRLVGP